MLARTRRVPTAAMATALGVVTATGVAAATVPSASATVTASTATATAFPPPGPDNEPRISTLPNGDSLVVTGSGPGATVMVLSPDGRSVPFTRFNADPGHVYVIPASAERPGQAFDPSRYLIPALSSGATHATPEYYPLHGVQINAIGLDGNLAVDGSVTSYLVNVDDVSRFAAPIPVANGVGRAAVPAGHYAAFTDFRTVDPTTGVATDRVVVQLDFTVADNGVSTLTADERTATSQLKLDTPKPTVNDYDLDTFGRTDVKGVTSGLAAFNTGTTYVSPTSAPPQLGAFTYQVLGIGAGSPAGTADPYRYDLMYPESDHIDADQTYPVDTSKLTTQHNTFDTDAGNTTHQGQLMMGSNNPDIGGVAATHSLTVPGKLTTYIGSPAGHAFWMRAVVPDSRLSATGLHNILMFNRDGDPYAGPVELWRTWDHGPLTAQVGQYQRATWCRACADGGTVDLALDPVVDSNPDTVATWFGPGPMTSHLTVYRDGAQVFSQDGPFSVQLSNQAQQPGSYRMVYDLDLSHFPSTQSTMTHTDITVPYTPTPDASWTLPSGNSCYASYAQPGGATPCSILPVLNLNYRLATDGTDTSHGRMQNLDLTVGHQTYGDAGSHAAATGATVSVSFDGGVTWTPACVTAAGDNHYIAKWANSGAAGSAPWLKVTATDALGGSITQTVANAYTIGQGGSNQ